MTVGTYGVDRATVVSMIADTHGLLRAEALEALRDAHLIIHAGDVGPNGVLEALERLAPVRTVRGNVDKGVWAEKLPRDALVRVGEIEIYVYHGHEEPGSAAVGCGVVVSGHLHKSEITEKRGVLYLNPGSAGPRHFKLPVTLMRLYISGKAVRPELVHLVGDDSGVTASVLNSAEPRSARKRTATRAHKGR